MFWDSLNQSGDVITPIAPRTAAAQGKRSPPCGPQLLFVLAGISPEGRLVVITGDPQILHSSTSAPIVIDTVGMYRRVAGPAIVSRGTGLADIVAIEDGGSLNWFTGTFAGRRQRFSGPVTEPSAVPFDPGARPALHIHRQPAARGGGRHRRFAPRATIDPVLLTMDVPIEVDATVPIARSVRWRSAGRRLTRGRGGGHSEQSARCDASDRRRQLDAADSAAVARWRLARSAA